MAGTSEAPALDLAFVGHDLVRGSGQGRAGMEVIRSLLDLGHGVTVYARSLDPELERRVPFRQLRRPPGPQIVDDVVMIVQATLALRSARHDAAVVLGHSALPPMRFAYYAQYSHEGWRRTWKRGARPTLRHRVHARLAIFLERAVARRASGVVACSVATADTIDVPPGAPRIVVPNGVDLVPVSGTEERVSARAALELPAQAFVVGFVGEFFTGRKGLDLLVDAVAGGRLDEHLGVAGTGNRRWLGRQARRQELRGRLHHLGFTDPRRVYDGSDVVAVPSRFEPFSLVVTEALARGTPVISALGVGAVPHLRGAVMPIQEPQSAGSVRRTLDAARDPAARRAMTEAARPLLEQLGWSRTARQVAEAALAMVRTS